MTMKQREILLRLNQQVKKLTESPPTTFSPNTGALVEEQQYQAQQPDYSKLYDTKLKR